MIKLCPSQETAFRGLKHAITFNPIAHLWGGSGTGKSTVLKELHRELGGLLLSIKDLLAEMRERHPLALEEAFEDLVWRGLDEHDCVIVDDMSLLDDVVGNCGNYPRGGWLAAPALALCARAESTGKKLIFGGDVPHPVRTRAFSFGIDNFEVADYAHLIREMLPESAFQSLNVEKVHRFAPGLSAHQLRNACLWLEREPGLTTQRFIDFLRSQGMTSNVDLSEVRQVGLDELEGIDEVRSALETHVALPLENDELTAAYGLKPKRGVLLLGPPGTGKTTIGRALAHRLQSKFFLVDGTFIAGTSGFYNRIHHVFEEAKRNAPAIIFIDDCDAIFHHGEELGFYRYLLTMLDGLESESLGRVCVMFTAMDVADLPPALIRSGRIELWLETKLPDADARFRILKRRLAGIPGDLGVVDLDRLVVETDGFTGADLSPLVEDAKNLFAYDRALGNPKRDPTEYFLQSIGLIRGNKKRYAEAVSRQNEDGPPRPRKPRFEVDEVPF